MDLRIGFGYDIHRLQGGRKLFLGGLEIPHSQGLFGHSDGDGLIHAIIDALLGALGEGDIGRHFPDSEAEYKNIRSTELLKRVMRRLESKKMKIIHLDTVIVAEAPNLSPCIDKIKKALAPLLGITELNLGIKAKTNEGIGLVGREKAMAFWAAVLIGEK